MKQRLTILLFLVTVPLFAQTLYTRTDTLSITTDSVTYGTFTEAGVVGLPQKVLEIFKGEKNKLKK